MAIPNYQAALRDFNDARRQAALQQLSARLTGQSTELLQYDEVRRQLRGGNTKDRGLQTVPLGAIVGSAGRYNDYTRAFLPTNDSDEERWARVKTFVEEKGFPPIELYKLGEAYFVKDGNHRVSIARQMGNRTIQAYVTEVETRVPLKPEDKPRDVLCKARYTDFLERTNLDTTRPQSNLYMTFCDRYEVLLEHINVHKYFVEEEQGRIFEFEEAAAHWYDHVYMHVIDLAQRLGLLHIFREITEADLYLLVAEHRAEVEAGLGYFLSTDTVVLNFAKEKNPQTGAVVGRMGEKLYGSTVPDGLEAGPKVGTWRNEFLAKRPYRHHLFGDILIAGRGVPADGVMLRHAALVCKREGGRLLAHHVVGPNDEVDNDEVRGVRSVFYEQCARLGIRGEFAVERGKLDAVVMRRAAWSDLIAISLVRDKGKGATTGFGTMFDQIIERSPRPVLVVPENANSQMEKALLLFDGSSKSMEALYAAAYIANCWGVKLVVQAAGPKDEVALRLKTALDYLAEQHIEAKYVGVQDKVVAAMWKTAAEHQCDFIIMGGFGYRPVFKLLVGSTVNGVLEETTCPVLICR